MKERHTVVNAVVRGMLAKDITTMIPTGTVITITITITTTTITTIIATTTTDKVQTAIRDIVEDLQSMVELLRKQEKCYLQKIAQENVIEREEGQLEGKDVHHLLFQSKEII